MPVDRSRYPANWDQISARIRERAGNKCERCGVENHAVGARDRDGVWHDERSIDCMNSDRGYELFGDYPKIIRIVLTVAHWPDPDPMNCADDNLQALCQKCHNILDAPMRAVNRKRTLGRRRLEAEKANGQQAMFEEEM